MRDFPFMTNHTDQVEPVPRRLRGHLGGSLVFDTNRAVNVGDCLEHPGDHVPMADLDPMLLTDDDHPGRLRAGPTRTSSSTTSPPSSSAVVARSPIRQRSGPEDTTCGRSRPWVSRATCRPSTRSTAMVVATMPVSGP